MNNSGLKIAALGALAAMAMAGSAAANPGTVQIFSTSYDMPNGDGQAEGGSNNYWDGTYIGSGSTTTSGAALSGGHGALTDGVIPTYSYNGYENPQGTGPYVGWISNYLGGTLNPVITFHFSGSPTITGITVWAENTGTGGVYAPGAILVDGVGQSFTPPSGVGPIYLTGLNLTGSSHTLELQQRAGQWEFVSEVTFSGSAAPEPAAWALMISGFGLAGAALRRRRVFA